MLWEEFLLLLYPHAEWESKYESERNDMEVERGGDE